MALVMRNDIATAELEALTADTEKALDWSESDERMLLVVDASSATTLTILHGDGIMGVSDLTLTVPTGISVIKLESMRFKNVSATNKAKIVVKSPGTPSVGTVAIV